MAFAASRILAASVLLIVTMGPQDLARAQARRPIEHEPIPPDPANDLAFGLRVEGDLPAAIETPSGLVSAPDPREPLPATPPLGAPPPTSLAGHDEGPSATSRFTPDTDTRRPDALPYSDPFVPSTAPWKRLVAFDAVDPDFTLRVKDTSLVPVPLREMARTDGSEELFYGDLVVDLRPNAAVRIPSVGPGARVLHARLGVGAEDIDFEIVHDGADNWFVRSKKSGRARLVFELSIPRAVFGGPFAQPVDDWHDPRWALPRLPPNVQRDAELVASKIGVPKATPRETIAALVDYFRGFSESNDPPSSNANAYLALALSKKGVCRHRAYAFMVTASGLGIQSRVVLNEAHAWVEVRDARLWKRIDLGGAGNILAEDAPPLGPSYTPPPDPFRWPPGAKRGEDLARTGLGAGQGGGQSGGQSGGGNAASGPSSAGPSTTGMSTPGSGPGTTPASHEDAPIPTLTIETTETSTSREQPVHVHGAIVADGTPCAHVAVAISAWERKTGAMFRLGELATDEHGQYTGVVVVPRSVVVGEYDIVASTPGNDRCHSATSQ